MTCRGHSVGPLSSWPPVSIPPECPDRRVHDSGGDRFDVAQSQALAFISESPVLSRHPAGGVEAARRAFYQYLQRGIRADPKQPGAEPRLPGAKDGCDLQRSGLRPGAIGAEDAPPHPRRNVSGPARTYYAQMTRRHRPDRAGQLLSAKRRIASPRKAGKLTPERADVGLQDAEIVGAPWPLCREHVLRRQLVGKACVGGRTEPEIRRSCRSQVSVP